MLRATRPTGEVIKLAALALITVLTLHLTMSANAKAAAFSGCSHAYCNTSSSCSSAANHDCCFSGGECRTISCILNPDGC